MEGLASNFEAVLDDFKSNLHGAMYAAVDMELTGTGIDGLPDSYSESAAERLAKLCEIAENHIPIQIGITLVKHDNNCFRCSSYSFYAFPWVGPELLGQDRSFLCTASALQFNVDNDHIDFNKWLKRSVRYMSCEDEARYLASPLSQGDADLPQKAGLLRVWKLLCEARLPLVTHCPLDIFFLLSCFEQRKLPRDPAEMAQLALQCLPCIFDTAHLHGAIGGFRRLKLVEFLEDARLRHAQLASLGKILPCCFELDQNTKMQYDHGSNHAHDAGFDSLCTAQLYAYLLNLAPEIVAQNSNRLYLFKSIEFLDLAQAARNNEIGSCLFESGFESLMVARLSQPKDATALRAISKAGFVYKRMDSFHFLITGHARSKTASKVAELESTIGGVQWLSFEQWCWQERGSAVEGHLDSAEVDADEATTTVGASSDSASTFSSDLESNRENCLDASHTLASLAWLGPEVCTN